MSDTIDQIPQIPASASPIAPGTLSRSGLPFDPARHIPKMHPKHGGWIGRSGGRKSKPAAPSSGSTSSPQESTAPDASANSSPSPADSPAADASAQLANELAANMPEVTVAPPANSGIPSDPKASFVPKIEPVPAAEAAAAAEKTKAQELEILESSDDIAEIISNGLYNLFGLIFDAPDEWGLAGAEHNRARKAIAAYIRARGGQISAGKALVFLAVAYALRGLAKPKSRAKAKEWTAYLKARLFPKKNAPIPVAPSPVESAPVESNFNPDYRAQ